MKDHNIVIGKNAGMDITNECLQFVIKTEDRELKTTLTIAEYNVIRPVVERMIKTQPDYPGAVVLGTGSDSVNIGHNTEDCLADHPVVGYEAGIGNKVSKVYCQPCKWIKIVNTNTSIGGCPPCACNHPDNMTVKHEDRWYCHFENKTYKQNPLEINKNNDCANFEDSTGFSALHNVTK